MPGTEKKAPVGRPADLDGGRKITIYLDAPSIKRAQEVGDGNISAGIRKALEDAVVSDRLATG